MVGRVGEIDRRVAAAAWVREACAAIASYRPRYVAQRLFNIGSLVTAQENACRYCYGANRAYMKIMGYSESFIRRIERDADMAELDPSERAFIAFCRNLARARPRPAKAELEHLIQLGFSSETVNEMAFLIAASSFYNRIGVLTACPPERRFEGMANGLLGRVIGTVTPIVRPLTERMARTQPTPAMESATLVSGPFGRVAAALAGSPAAIVVKSALDGAFASPVLSRATKGLMFAVVARSLECRYSEAEARRLLEADGYTAADIDSAISTLNSQRLPAHESQLLPWVRDTVHYQTAAIQDRTRTLVANLGNTAALEAIGIAALANSTVRLAMLLE